MSLLYLCAQFEAAYALAGGGVVGHDVSDAELDNALVNGCVVTLQPGQTLQSVFLFTSDPLVNAQVTATSSFASPGTGKVLASVQEKTITVLEQVCGFCGSIVHVPLNFYRC